MENSQIKKGILLGYINYAVTILTQLLYVPIMLKLMGQHEYGTYQLVASVANCLSLLTMGLNHSYFRFYFREKEKSETDVAKLNGMYLMVHIILAIVVVILGTLLSCNAEVILGSKISAEEYEVAAVLMRLLSINIAFTFINSVFYAIVAAHEQYVFQKIVDILRNVLNPFLVLPLLLLGYGSIGMVTVSLDLTICAMFVNAWYCLKKLKVMFIFYNLNFSVLKEIYIFSFFIFLNTIVDQINWSVDKYILGRVAGTVSVAIYSVGSEINTVFVFLSDMIASLFAPRLNQMIAKNANDESVNSLFVKIGRLQAIIIFMIVSGFFFFGKLFIKYWAGDVYGKSYYVALILMIAASIPLIQSFGVDILRAKNMHQFRSILLAIIAIFNLLISIPLAMSYEEIGSAIGTGVALMIGNTICMNIYYARKVGINIKGFWREILKITKGLLIPILLGTMLNYFWIKESLIVLCVKLGLYVLVYAISIYVFSLNLEEKKIIRKSLKKFLN